MAGETLDYTAVLDDAMSPVLEAISAQMDDLGATVTAASEEASASLDQLSASASDAAATFAASAGGVDAATASLDANTASADENAAATDNAAAAHQGASASMGGMVLPALAVVAAVGVLGVASVKMAGDFQASMTSLVTGADESQANLKLVSNGILQMAVATGTSTAQLAQGAYEVESAGFHGAAALTILQMAAEGAKVGNADLLPVTNAVTSALNAYGLSGNQAAEVTNTLIATTAAGKMHMQDLAGALAGILAPAHASGVSLQEVGAMLATMTMQGTPAADAATYLKQMFIALDAPASKAAKTLTEIGLSSDQVSQTMRKQPDGMIAALREINAALDTKFPEAAKVMRGEMAKVKAGQETMDQAMANLASNTSPAYVGALKNISGGSKNMMAMLELTGTNLQNLQGNFDQITHSVQQGGNSINGWNLVQQDFNFKMQRAGAVVETLMIGLGDKLLPVVGKLADLFSASVVPILSGFVSLLENNQAVLITVAGILGGVLVGAVTALATALWGMVAPLLIAVAPFIAVGIAVTALAVTFKHFYDTSAPFRVLVQEIAAALGGALHDALKAAQRALVDAQPQLHALMTALNGLKPVLTIIASVLGVALTVAIGVVMGAINGLIGAFQGIIEMVTGVVTIVGGIISLFVDLATGHFNKLSSDIGRIFGGIVTLFKGAFDAVLGLVTGFIGGIIGWFQHLFDKLVGHSIVTDLITAIVSLFTGLPGRILGLLGGFVGNVIGFFGNMAKGVISHVTGMVGNVLDLFTDQGKKAADLAAIQRDKVAGAALTQKIAVTTQAIEQHQQALHAAQLQRQDIIQEIEQCKNGVEKRALEQKLAVVNQHILMQQGAVAATELMRNSMVLKLDSLKADAAQHAKDIHDNILNGLTDLPGKLLGLGGQIMAGLKNGIEGALGGIKNAVGNVAGGILSSVKGIFGIHSPSSVMADEVGRPLMEGIALGLTQHAHLAAAALAGITSGLASSATGTRLGSSLASAGGAGGSGAGHTVTICLDKSIMLLDPATRRQIAQELAGDLAAALTSRAKLQVNLSTGYTGS